MSFLALSGAYGHYWADVLGWINANQALAGWVQALGSIAAVIGTWWATKHQIGVAELMRKRAAASREVDLNRACLKAATTSHRLLKKDAKEYVDHWRVRQYPDRERTEFALDVARTLLAKELQGETLIAMIDCVTCLGILLALMQMRERGESWDTEVFKLFHARSLSGQVRWRLRKLLQGAESELARLG